MSVLKKRAQAIDRLRSQDIDPEDDSFRQQHSDDESDDEDTTEVGGREHYESVEKSKLREPEQPQLSKKYGGVAVSRSTLEDDDDDDDPFAPLEDDEDEDPFAVGATSDDSQDSDDSGDVQAGDVDSASGDESDDAAEQQPPTASNARKQKARVNGTNDMNSDAEIDNQSNSDESPSGDSDDSDKSASDSAGSDVRVNERTNRISSSRDKLRALNAAQSSESALVSSLTASNTDQARKGAAVEQQQSVFDRLLNSRIKLQKAVAISNDFATPMDSDRDLDAAAAKAESAALSLWTTIDAIRCDMLSQQQESSTNTKKRKISALEASSSTPLSELYSHSADLESACMPYRQATLNHWYSRTRPATAPSTSRSALASGPDTTTISTVLSTYLNTSLPKLLDSSTPTPQTYDDTPFYQSLLTSLIASRTNAASLPSSLPSTLPTTKNPKVRKNVDTKASKGRKIRYTVHEKLQNFMASEDRSTWTEEGRREFFGSLFGQQTASNENGANGGGHDGEPVDGDAEESALRLFRRTAVSS